MLSPSVLKIVLKLMYNLKKSFCLSLQYQLNMLVYTLFFVFWVQSANALVSKSNTFSSNRVNLNRNRLSTSLSVTAEIMPPADLTPAVDKYARLPGTGSHLEAEGRILKQYDHPNIVRFIGKNHVFNSEF